MFIYNDFDSIYNCSIHQQSKLSYITPPSGIVGLLAPKNVYNTPPSGIVGLFAPKNVYKHLQLFNTSAVQTFLGNTQSNLLSCYDLFYENLHNKYI
jgi:hypothetical protein